MEAPTGPGLGIDLDPDALSSTSYDGAWRLPHWNDPVDGALLPW